MWSRLIEVHDICFEEPIELLLLEDQAFSPYAPQKTFTDGIRLGSSIRGSKHLDATRGGHARKIRPKFAIIIPNQIAWPFSIRSRFPKLLRDPGIGRRSGHIHVDDLARRQLNDEKGKKRTEEEIGHLQKITGPTPPTSLPSDYAGMFSNSVHGLVWDESASCTFG